MASTLASTANDLKECPICLEDMINKEPKLLDCKHSFCKPCLTRLDINRSASQATLTCPVCKHISPLPGDSVARLPDNFLLLQIKSVLDKVAERRGNFCFYCDKFNKYVTAYAECLECQRYLCEVCLQRHDENSQFRGHESRMLAPPYNRDICKEHNEEILYVCTTCSPNRMFCDVCMIAGDLCRHDDTLVKWEDFSLERAKKTLSSLLGEKENVKKSLDQILAVVEKQEDGIEKHKIAMFQAIEDNSISMVDALREASNIEGMTIAAENLLKTCESTSQILTMEGESIASIKSATNDLQMAFETYYTEKSRGKQLSFVPAVLPSLGILESSVDSEELVKDTEEIKVETTRREQATGVADSVASRPLNPSVSAAHLTLVSRKQVTTSFNTIRAGRDGSIFYVDSSDQTVHEMTPQGKIIWDIDTNTGLSVSQCYIDTIRDYLFVFKHFGGHNSFTKLNMPRRRNTSTRCSGEKECLDTVFNFCAMDEDTLVYITDGALRKYMYTPQAACVLHNDTNVLLSDNSPIIIRLGDLVGGTDFAIVYPTKRTIQLYDIDGQVKNKVLPEVVGKLYATINEMGNFLVADSDTCRVSEITTEGYHVRDLLTRNNGIYWPVGLVYSAPYLWVFDREGFHEYLKCFRLSQ